MTVNRPHFQDSIAQLEQRVEQSRADRQKLQIIAAELKHRETDRARRLRAKITAILDGLELTLTPPVSSPVVSEESAAPSERPPVQSLRRNRLDSIRARLEIETAPPLQGNVLIASVGSEELPEPELMEPTIQVAQNPAPVATSLT